jgi:hypothetical protein
VEVAGAGGLWRPASDQDSAGGRGLLIVVSLASDWGVSDTGADGRTIWFEIDCAWYGSIHSRCDLRQVRVAVAGSRAAVNGVSLMA